MIDKKTVEIYLNNLCKGIFDDLTKYKFECERTFVDASAVIRRIENIISIIKKEPEPKIPHSTPEEKKDNDNEINERFNSIEWILTKIVARLEELYAISHKESNHNDKS
jgi:hypothetical protein